MVLLEFTLCVPFRSLQLVFWTVTYMYMFKDWGSGIGEKECCIVYTDMYIKRTAGAVVCIITRKTLHVCGKDGFFPLTCVVICETFDSKLLEALKTCQYKFINISTDNKPNARSLWFSKTYTYRNLYFYRS